MLQESASLHGKETVAVGIAAHPHGRVTTAVLVHCGTRQVAHAVAVRVKVGQLTVLHGWVTVLVSVVALTLTLVTTLVLTTVAVTLTVCSRT